MKCGFIDRLKEFKEIDFFIFTLFLLLLINYTKKRQKLKMVKDFKASSVSLNTSYYDLNSIGSQFMLREQNREKIRKAFLEKKRKQEEKRQIGNWYRKIDLFHLYKLDFNSNRK